jgi:hypothetical protein
MASIRNIKKSNKYQTVDYSEFSHEEYQNLLHSGSKVEPRKKAAQELLNYLCDKYGIPRCPIFVFNTTYDPKFGFTCMGLYQGVKEGITLWNNRHYKVPCDIRTFINTLLHEFMHHYDYYYLRLPDSVHCKGFESRIRDLRRKLAS